MKSTHKFSRRVWERMHVVTCAPLSEQTTMSRWLIVYPRKERNPCYGCCKNLVAELVRFSYIFFILVCYSVYFFLYFICLIIRFFSVRYTSYTFYVYDHIDAVLTKCQPFCFLILLLCDMFCCVFQIWFLFRTCSCVARNPKCLLLLLTVWIQRARIAQLSLRSKFSLTSFAFSI